jgi:hypothetical protein
MVQNHKGSLSVKKYFSVKEAADYLNQNPSSIYYLIRTKKIIAEKVPIGTSINARKCWRIFSISVRAYINSQLNSPSLSSDTLGYHPETIRRLAREGQIEAHKQGKHWVVDPKFLKKFIKMRNKQKHLGWRK